MEQTVAFALGALVAAAKGLGIAAIGFGVAWWRAKKRIQELEDERPSAALLEQRVERLQASIDSMAAAVKRLGSGGPGLPAERPPGAEQPGA